MQQEWQQLTPSNEELVKSFITKCMNDKQFRFQTKESVLRGIYHCNEPMIINGIDMKKIDTEFYRNLADTYIKTMCFLTELEEIYLAD